MAIFSSRHDGPSCIPCDSLRVLLVTAGFMVLVMTFDALRNYFHLKNQQREYVQIQADEKAGKKLTLNQEDKKKEWEEAVAEYSPSTEDLKKETDAHLGSYFKLVTFRAKYVYRGHRVPIYLPALVRLSGRDAGWHCVIKLGVLCYSQFCFDCLITAPELPAVWMVFWAAKQHFNIDPGPSLAVRMKLGASCFRVHRLTASGN